MFPLCTLVLLVTSAAPPRAAPRAVQTDGLASAAALTPWLGSAEAFGEAKNKEPITRALHVLANLRHPFFREPGSSSTGVSELFAREAERAEADFSAGKTESARFRVQALTQLCLACHLREPGPGFVDSSRAPDALRLRPLQQARYLATTRQFDRALAVWRVELKRPAQLEAEQFEQFEALRLALRVAVRVKDDASLARKLIAPQLARAELPGFALRELEAWDAAARAWEAERFVLTQRTPLELVARARALVTSSAADSQSGPIAAHFLSLLRAASYLDEAMRRTPQASFRGEALYLLGVVHPSISEASLWRLEWMYFEACIRESPGSAQAQLCGQRLQDRTWVFWSTGADMPASTQGALRELLLLARVEMKEAAGPP